jgi:uncharacterized cupin superfamily protein
MHPVNMHTAVVEYDSSAPPGFRAGSRPLGTQLGASLIGGTVYELPPGESNCPYHYEFGSEEWLIVLSGRPSVRRPSGEVELEAGDVLCFPDGPTGAHRLLNRSDEVARVLMLATKGRPAAAVYPDSDKIGVWFDAASEAVIVPRSAAVGYWEGEA